MALKDRDKTKVKALLGGDAYSRRNLLKNQACRVCGGVLKYTDSRSDCGMTYQYAKCETCGSAHKARLRYMLADIVVIKVGRKDITQR